MNRYRCTAATTPKILPKSYPFFYPVKHGSWVLRLFTSWWRQLRHAWTPGVPDQSPLSNPFFPCRISIHGYLEFSFVLNLKTHWSQSPRVMLLVSCRRVGKKNRPPQLLQFKSKIPLWRKAINGISAMQSMQIWGRAGQAYQNVKCNAQLRNRLVGFPNFRIFAVFHPKKYSIV